MWVQSSDEQTGPILCDCCNKMIEEKSYIEHWLPCKTEHSKPKSKPPAAQPKQQKKPEKAESGQQETIPCPTCGQNITLASIDQHIATCQQLMVECSYCNGKLPVHLLEMHESSCESNDSQGQLNMDSMQQLINLMENRNGNGGGNGNGNRNGNGGLNPNLLEALLRANNANGNGNGNGNGGLNPNLLGALLQARMAAANGQMGNGSQNGFQGGGLMLGGGLINPSEQLLHESLFPALRKMDQGIKKRDLNQFPTEKYSKETHSEPKCAICQQEFQEGNEVMKITCSHIHHAECYKKWLQRNNTCPLCKAVIRPKSKPKKGE